MNTERLEQLNKYDLTDKERTTKDSVFDWLNRTLTMFTYGGLPESLPERELEIIAQCNGYGIATEHKDDIVALWGSWAPPYDVYYRAKNVLVCNPWADINRTYEIDKDCVLFRNDPLNRGLLPLFNKYASMMTEAEITFMRALINFRAMFVFTGDADADAATAEIFMQRLEEGKAGSVVTGGFENQMQANPLLGAAGNYITQSIEAQQYILGMFYQKIGLQSTFNMKRERLTAEESSLDTDPLRPLIDAMLEEREIFVDKLNKKYGLNVTVEFNSSWEKYNKSLVTDGDGMPVEEVETEETPVEETSEETPVEETSEETTTEETPVDEESVNDALETVEEIVEDIKEIVEETTEEDPALKYIEGGNEDEDKESSSESDD